MPVYVYRRQDGSSFELAQRITGSGFYSTDSRKPEPKEPQPSGGGGTGAEAGAR